MNYIVSIFIILGFDIWGVVWIYLMLGGVIVSGRQVPRMKFNRELEIFDLGFCLWLFYDFIFIESLYLDSFSKLLPWGTHLKPHHP
jgi:hypothetical protein